VAKAVLNRIAGVLRHTDQKDRTKKSDSELIDQFCKHQDEEAFASLVRRHSKVVLNACRQVLTDPADIDDAFQAVFLVLLQKIATIDDTCVAAWLYAVAHRVAVRARSDNRRRSIREGTAASRRQVEAPTPDPSWREAVAILHEELNRMPDAYRRVLLLCYLNGQSREEAGANLGWTPGAVKGRLERGRNMLAGRLVKRGITLSVGFLAVATGNSVGMDGPSTRLIELTTRTLAGIPGPKSAVTALAHGAFPMANTAMKLLAIVVAIAGVTAMTVLYLANSRAEEPDKAVPVTPLVTVSKGDPPSPAAPQKTPEKVQPINGTVVDASDSPVAGATIIALSNRGAGERLITTSDAKGKFSFNKLLEAKPLFPMVQLIVVREGFGPVMTHHLQAAKNEVNFTLPNKGKYSGTVRDSADNTVAGAEIQVGFVDRYEQNGGKGASWGFVPAEAVRGSAAERFYLTKTDKNGRFELTDLPADKEIIFRVTAKGFGELDTGAGGPPELQYVVKPDAKPADLVLQKEAVIRGQIACRVPNVAIDTIGVQVEGYNELHGLHRIVKPNAKGQFAISGLPAGSISISLVLPSDAPATAEGKEVATVSGETKDVSLEVIAGVEVTGQVQVSATGEPLAGIQMAAIGLVNPQGFHFAIKPTTDDGKFKLLLPPGKVILIIWSPPTGYRSPQARNPEIEIPADVTKFTIPDPYELIREKKGS